VRNGSDGEQSGDEGTFAEDSGRIAAPAAVADRGARALEVDALSPSCSCVSCEASRTITCGCLMKKTERAGSVLHVVGAQPSLNSVYQFGIVCGGLSVCTGVPRPCLPPPVVHCH